MSSFKFKSMDIPIEITYKNAMFDFPKLGLNLLDMFQEDAAALKTIFLDDSIMIKVWWHYIEGHASTLEEAINHLTPEGMTEFREAFLNAVTDFINPQMRPAFVLLLKEMKKDLASPGEKLKKALSESLEEPE